MLLAERIPDLRAAQPRPTTGSLTFSADWETGAGRSTTGPPGDLFAEWVQRWIDGERPALERVEP